MGAPVVTPLRMPLITSGSSVSERWVVRSDEPGGAPAHLDAHGVHVNGLSGRDAVEHDADRRPCDSPKIVTFTRSP